MPNHVHVLIRPQQDMPLARIVQSWKSYTARRIRERRAPARHEKRQVWQREYWDRFIRHEGHFRDVVAYIHRNPVQAGLCTRPEDWRWSSASRWAELELGAPGDS